MIQSIKDQLIAQIEMLPEEKQAALLQLVETLSQETPVAERDVILDLLTKLEARGEVVLPDEGVFQARTKPRAVPSRGTPVSEMIIEARR